MRLGNGEREKGKGGRLPVPAHYQLVVWREAMSLVQRVFELTRNFPKQDYYVLGQHIQKSAISIPSNIAEGAGRGSSADYARFLRIARGSLMELDTQVRIAANARLLDRSEELIERIRTLNAKLNALIRSKQHP